jgi:regulator of protease activity HflC (stomatin/prohibitin superfamily)
MMAAITVSQAEEPNGPWAQSAKLAFRFLYGVVLVLAVGWLASNFRQIPPDSRAVVLRFGSIDRQHGSGLVMAWPRPIEQVVVLPTADRQVQFAVKSFDIGMTASAEGVDFSISGDPRDNAGFLLTGDAGVIHLQAALFYRIIDPTAYLLAERHIGPALERLFTASAVAVCAGRDIDTILVARPEKNAGGNALASREQLRGDLLNAVNQRLEKLSEQGDGLGIEVSRVDVSASLPSGAKYAFNLVLQKAQTADQDIAIARTDAERAAQMANQDRDRVLSDAQAAAEETVTKAKTRTAEITALIPQLHSPAGKAIANRLYYERIGKILGKAQQVDTFDPKNGTRLILPGVAQ